MAWLPITNNPDWEYNNAPADPAGNPQKHALWLKSTAGIRTQPDGTEIYVECRRVGTTISAGEVSKSYWDAR
jgi:hypothetical protein